MSAHDEGVALCVACVVAKPRSLRCCDEQYDQQENRSADDRGHDRRVGTGVRVLHSRVAELVRPYDIASFAARDAEEQPNEPPPAAREDADEEVQQVVDPASSTSTAW